MKKILCLAAAFAAAFAAGARAADNSMMSPREMMRRQMEMQARQRHGAGTMAEPHGTGTQEAVPWMGPRAMSMGPGNAVRQRRRMMGMSGGGPGVMGVTGMAGPGLAYPMAGFAQGEERRYFEAYEQYLKDTKEQRRRLWDLRFDYREALWNPDTTLKELRDLAERMTALQEQLTAKMPRRQEPTEQ